MPETRPPPHERNPSAPAPIPFAIATPFVAEPLTGGRTVIPAVRITLVAGGKPIARADIGVTGPSVSLLNFSARDPKPGNGASAPQWSGVERYPSSSRTHTLARLFDLTVPLEEGAAQSIGGILAALLRQYGAECRPMSGPHE
jgi:hypothetical protein